MKKYFKIIVGAFIMGIGQNVFLIPNKIAAGGISGIATILEHTIGIRPSVVVLVLNIPLFITAFVYLGRKFVLTSILGTVSYSIALEITQVYSFYGDNLIVSVLGGVLTGIGLGIVFKSDATTGGTDVAAKLLKINFPHISVGKLILIIDGIIITLSAIVFKNLNLAVYATISLYITTIIVDRMIEGIDFAKAVYIISEKNQEISSNIMSKINRGVTGLKGIGMYSKEDTTILLCVLKNYELAKLKSIVYEIDDKAFFITCDVREVMGEGFKNI